MDLSDSPIAIYQKKAVGRASDLTPVFPDPHDLIDEFMQGEPSWRRLPARGSSTHAKVAELKSSERTFAPFQAGAHAWHEGGNVTVRPLLEWDKRSDLGFRPKFSDHHDWTFKFFMNINDLEKNRFHLKNSVRREIFGAESHNRVIEILLENGMDRFVADYYDHLQARQEELEEDESPGIILQSLQSWAWFLIDFAKPKKLPYAKMSADYDGCINLEWRLSDEYNPIDPDNAYWGNGRGIAVLRFYPSNVNALSILSGPYASEKRRLSFEGQLSHMKTIQVIDIFAERFLDGNG